MTPFPSVCATDTSEMRGTKRKHCCSETATVPQQSASSLTCRSLNPDSMTCLNSNSCSQTVAANSVMQDEISTISASTVVPQSWPGQSSSSNSRSEKGTTTALTASETFIQPWLPALSICAVCTFSLWMRSFFLQCFSYLPHLKNVQVERLINHCKCSWFEGQW